MNKQPKDGDKPSDHQFDDESFDLLGLDTDGKQGRDGSGEQSGTSSEEQTTSTGRTYKKRDDGMVYRQPDNPTRWSRRSVELPTIPEQNPPGQPADGEKEAPAPEGTFRRGKRRSSVLLQPGEQEVPEAGRAWPPENGEETTYLG